MRKGMVCMLVAFSCFSLFAQTKTAHTASSFAISVNPLSLFDLRFPTLQMSVQGASGPVGIIYTFGPAINTFNWNKRDLEDKLLSYNGSKHKLTIQYLLQHRFIGLEYFQTAFQKERQNGRYRTAAVGTYYTYDYAKQKVDVFGLSLKAGITHRFNERFFLIYANSLGMRKQTVRFVEARNLQAHSELFGIGHVEGTKLLPHFSMELSFGYKIF